MTLSYGLIKVPKKGFERRTPEVILNFYYFEMMKLNEQRKESFYKYEKVYAVY